MKDFRNIILLITIGLHFNVKAQQGPIYNFNFTNGVQSTTPSSKVTKAPEAKNINSQTTTSRPGFFDRFTDDRSAIEVSFYGNEIKSNKWTWTEFSWNEETDEEIQIVHEDFSPEIRSFNGLKLAYNIQLDSGISITPGLVVQNTVFTTGKNNFEGQTPGVSLDLRYETPAAFYNVFGLIAGASAKVIKGTYDNGEKLHFTHMNGEIYGGPKFVFKDTVISLKYLAGTTKDTYKLNNVITNPNGQSYKGLELGVAFKI